MKKVQDLEGFRLPSGFRGRSAFIVQFWWILRDTFFLHSPQFMYGWRNWLLRLFGAKIGKGVLIRPTVRITYPWKLKIEGPAWVGDFVELYNLSEIHLKPNTVVSQHSYLCTGGHDYKKPTFDMRASPITVESEAWIAADVFVGPGVTVGYGAVIGARSTLLSDAPALSILVGSPARVVGLRDTH